MQKNILIYSHVALWEIHHAETIEIALKHLAEGDKVYFLSCFGSLKSCPANSFHEESACVTCRKQSNYSIRKILGNRADSIVLDLQDSNFVMELDGLMSYDTVKKYTYKTVPMGELVLSQLIGEVRDSYLDFSNQDIRDRATNLLKNAIALYEFTREIIGNKSIEVVYAWNGRRCSDGPVLYAARDQGKKFYAYISGGRKNSYITMPTVKIHDLSYNKFLIESVYSAALKGSNETKIQEISDEFYRSSRYGGGDFPGFVSYRSLFIQDGLNIPPNDDTSQKKILVIFPSSFWEFSAMGDWLNNVYPYNDFYSGITALLEDHRIRDSYEILIRWHPNLINAGQNEKAKYQYLMTQHNSITQWAPEEKIDSYKLLEKSDVVVTFGSTIGIEAAYYGKPSILLGPCMYEETGSCYRPKTHEELVLLLASDVKPLSRLGAIKYGYFQRRAAQHEFSHLRQNAQGQFFNDYRPLNHEAIRTIFIGVLKKLGIFDVCRSWCKKFSNLYHTH